MNETHLDQYGGYTGLHFDATGFFRLEKTDRWWLVTPDGNAFISFGVNHMYPSLMKTSYNREHWIKEFNISEPSDAEAYLVPFLEKAKSDLSTLGMNTLGTHTEEKFYGESFVPYVQQCRFVDNCHYMRPTKENFFDVFAQEFADHCDAIVRDIIVPRKDDPYLLGIAMTDCPVFTGLDAAPRINNIYGAPRPGLPTWPVVLRNLDGNSPGKQAYVATMKALYDGDIGRFNSIYNTHFKSFDELSDAANWRESEDCQNEKEVDDNLQFLYKILDQQYTVQVAAIRKQDQNHLIFGDKLNGNSNTPNEIVELADKHMDLIFYQYYAFPDDQQDLLAKWAPLTDKPFIMGDSNLAVPSENALDPYGPHCLNQEHRADLFTKMFNNLFSRPDYVGWHWCGWMDAWKEHQNAKQHGGLQTPFGEFHGPMLAAMQEFSSNMYEIARHR